MLSKIKKYGWFWTCPNGGEACQYRHCLPKGYTLKIDAPKEVELDDVNIADQLEEERQKLRENAENLTPVTLERFLEWKKRKEEERRKKEEEEAKKRSEDIKSGRTNMSGRELLTFNPELFIIDDDDVMDVEEYKKETDGVEQGEEEKEEKGFYNSEDEENADDTPQYNAPTVIDESLFKEEDLPEDSDE